MSFNLIFKNKYINEIIFKQIKLINREEEKNQLIQESKQRSTNVKKSFIKWRQYKEWNSVGSIAKCNHFGLLIDRLKDKKGRIGLCAIADDSISSICQSTSITLDQFKYIYKELEKMIKSQIIGYFLIISVCNGGNIGIFNYVKEMTATITRVPYVSCMETAIRNGHLELFLVLLKGFKQVNADDGNGDSPRNNICNTLQSIFLVARQSQSQRLMAIEMYQAFNQAFGNQIQEYIDDKTVDEFAIPSHINLGLVEVVDRFSRGERQEVILNRGEKTDLFLGYVRSCSGVHPIDVVYNMYIHLYNNYSVYSTEGVKDIFESMMESLPGASETDKQLLLIFKLSMVCVNHMVLDRFLRPDLNHSVLVYIVREIMTKYASLQVATTIIKLEQPLTPQQIILIIDLLSSDPTSIIDLFHYSLSLEDDQLYLYIYNNYNHLITGQSLQQQQIYHPTNLMELTRLVDTIDKKLEFIQDDQLESFKSQTRILKYPWSFEMIDYIKLNRTKPFHLINEILFHIEVRSDIKIIERLIQLQTLPLSSKSIDLIYSKALESRYLDVTNLVTIQSIPLLPDPIRGHQDQIIYNITSNNDLETAIQFIKASKHKINTTCKLLESSSKFGSLSIIEYLLENGQTQFSNDKQLDFKDLCFTLIKYNQLPSIYKLIDYSKKSGQFNIFLSKLFPYSELHSQQWLLPINQLIVDYLNSNYKKEYQGYRLYVKHQQPSIIGTVFKEIGNCLSGYINLSRFEST